MPLATATTQVLPALVGVGIGGLISILTFRASTRTSAINNLREQLIEIIELRYEQRRLDQHPEDPDYGRRSRLVNGKRNIRLAMARDVAAGLTRSMSVYECITLGFECDANAEYEAGREFLELAVKKAESRSSITRTEALRYLGGHYLDPGPEHDPERGSSYYEASIEATAGDQRPYFVYMAVLGYRGWAGKLKAIGDASWRDKALRARELCEGLPADFVYRASELQEIDTLLGVQAADQPDA